MLAAKGVSAEQRLVWAISDALNYREVNARRSFCSLGYSPNLERLQVFCWAKISGCMHLQTVEAKKLWMENCTASKLVRTGDGKLTLRNCSVEHIETSSRNIVLRNTSVGRLVVLVPKKRSLFNCRSIKLVNSNVENVVIQYLEGGKKVSWRSDVTSTMGAFSYKKIENTFVRRRDSGGFLMGLVGLFQSSSWT
ncbi:hypothetical protein K0U07_00810 [bacterium]|nr:hypothetical protein [bacterium]